MTNFNSLRLLAPMILASFFAPVAAQDGTVVADFMFGKTEAGEDCYCKANEQEGVPEIPTSVVSDIVLSNVECDPEDFQACQANCAGLHGVDQYLTDKCCAYVGQSASLLAFEEDSQWVPRLEEFNKCTGARVRLEYLPEGEDGMADALRNDLGDDISHDQGIGGGQGIFDAYIVQAPWLWPVVNGLENLSPRIRESADTVKFLDINPASRSAVSYNGTVRALPLDTDYIALGWRQDVFHKHQIPEEMTPPRTIQELAEVAEALHGLDHNEDGEGDWGICLTPQVNYFHAFVAPLMQSALLDPVTGAHTGQNMFFSADSFDPLVRQPAFKTAVETYYKIIRNSNCGEQLARGEKCDRKAAFPTGRCAMVISMPGTLTKMLLGGAKYAPLPRTDETTGEVLWDINDMPLGDGGSYWGRRAPFPGSTVVQKWDANAGYPLVECGDKDGDNCPLADENGINFAPFFAEGGEAYALNGRQAKPAARNIMWDLFAWLSELPETELPLSGQYRTSHLNEEHRKDLTDQAGWPNQMVDDIFSLLGEYFKSEEEGGNPVQDLLMLGFPEYMDALDEELHHKFLGVSKDSTGGVFNREDPHQSVDPYLDQESYNKAYADFVDALEDRYNAISASMSGGRMGQLQRWRSSLNLPLRTDEELCIAVLSSNNREAFLALKCVSRVSFESLCHSQPEVVANFDEKICGSMSSDTNLAIVIPVIVVGMLLLSAVVMYFYAQWKKRQADSLWQIDGDELTFKDPIEVIGHGRFGEVVLAEYRGSAVAVKTINPEQLKKSTSDVDEEGGTPEQALSKRKSASPRGLRSSTTRPGSSTLRSSDSNNWKSRGEMTSKALGLATSKALGLSTTSKNKNLQDQFVKEIRLLVNLREHRNIVGVMGAVLKGTDQPKLVLEYMQRGSLFDLLHNNAQPLGGQLLHNILSDVIQGVRFLHNANPMVVHSDLKSSNILIDDRWRVKLADFGWKKNGTLYWTAPEVLRRETGYTPESDVYALGITMYEMYSRETPYAGEEFDRTLQKVANPKVNKRPPTPSTMSPPVANMMRDCLVSKPEERPTLNELGARINRLTIEDVQYQTPSDPKSQVMFPPEVAKALSQGHTVGTQTHENASVVYCDIVGFGALSSELPPVKIDDLLQRAYDRLDQLADNHGVFVVDMMAGGAWMGATNCVQHQPADHASRVARFAIEALQAVGKIMIDEEDPARGFLQLQTAIVSGPVQGKVVGTRTPRYSLFGPSVEAVTNLATSKSVPGRIVCTEAIQGLLEQQARDIPVELKARIYVPGLGATLTFWMNGAPEADPSPSADDSGW